MGTLETICKLLHKELACVAIQLKAKKGLSSKRIEL